MTTTETLSEDWCFFASSTSRRAAMTSASPVWALVWSTSRVNEATCAEDRTSPNSPSDARTTARSSALRGYAQTSGSAVTTCALTGRDRQSFPRATLSRKFPKARVMGKLCSPTKT
eukprot:scaffold5696_cov119-Isochrysis_galbana.AAC.7